MDAIKNIENSSFEAFEFIKWQLDNEHKVIHLSGEFKLTKTQSNYMEASIIRDFNLHEDTYAWLERRSSFDATMIKYKNYDPELQDLAKPKHYPMRVLSGLGSACSNDNIFMFFPEVLGVSSSKIEDYFGFEFIDMWENVFNEIVLPCVRNVFGKEFVVDIYSTLAANLQKTIFLASIFHEVGHRVGPWKVSPGAHQNLKVRGYRLDVMGELATDSLLVRNLSDFPEIAYFVFLQRLFWFPRKQFCHSPLMSNINEDNDAWIGAYLWNRAVTMKVISFNGEKLQMASPEKIRDLFIRILDEIDVIGNQVLFSEDLKQQETLIDDWMKEHVEIDNDGRFILPRDMVAVFKKCHFIPYKPFFQPLLLNT